MTNNRPSGLANPWLVLWLEVVCVLVYELLQKRGASATAHLSAIWSWTGVTALASPLVWLAMLLMIVSLLSWLYVLRYIPLSIAFPLSRMVDVLIPLSCWIILEENISPRRWCGIVLVIVGLMLTAKPVARLEEKL
jgi:drug/metabolite transporter (DMT)-like permease